MSYQQGMASASTLERIEQPLFNPPVSSYTRSLFCTVVLVTLMFEAIAAFINQQKRNFTTLQIEQHVPSMDMLRDSNMKNGSLPPSIADFVSATTSSTDTASSVVNRTVLIPGEFADSGRIVDHQPLVVNEDVSLRLIPERRNVFQRSISPC